MSCGSSSGSVTTREALAWGTAHRCKPVPDDWCVDSKCRRTHRLDEGEHEYLTAATTPDDATGCSAPKPSRGIVEIVSPTRAQLLDECRGDLVARGWSRRNAERAAIAAFSYAPEPSVPTADPSANNFDREAVYRRALLDARAAVEAVLDDHGTAYPLAIGAINELINEVGA